jgi:hypothetical protein
VSDPVPRVTIDSSVPSERETAMETSTARNVVLGQEDTARVNRLTEEIQGRLEELAALSCRALGVPLTADMVRRFVPSGGAAAPAFDAGPSFHHIELLDTPTDPPIPVTVTYYDDGTISVEYGPFTP